MMLFLPDNNSICAKEVLTVEVTFYKCLFLLKIVYIYTGQFVYESFENHSCPRRTDRNFFTSLGKLATFSLKLGKNMKNI